jgi:hypothetical protein
VLLFPIAGCLDPRSGYSLGKYPQTLSDDVLNVIYQEILCYPQEVKNSDQIQTNINIGIPVTLAKHSDFSMYN